MSERYYDVRKAAGIHVGAKTRTVALHGWAVGFDVAAKVAPERVAHVERIIEEAVAACEAHAANRWGFDQCITVRRDWTWRSYSAVSPRSRGGIYTGYFRSFDDADDADIIRERGAGISLRLCRYASDVFPAVWTEYASFNHSPLIGGRREITTDDALRFLAAHECAHAIEFNLPFPVRKDIAAEWFRSGNYIDSARRYYGPTIQVGEAPVKVSAHGAAWQGIYCELRDHLGLNSVGVVHEYEIDAGTGRRPRETKHNQTCAHCGAEFLSNREDAKFCSARCRVAAHRAAR